MGSTGNAILTLFTLARRLSVAQNPALGRNQAFHTMSTRMASQIRLTTPPMDAMRPRSTVAMCACAAADTAAGGAEPTAVTAAAQAHVATVERGRIASIGGVVSLIWLAILVLMVWNA